MFVIIILKNTKMILEFDESCLPPKFKNDINTIQKWMNFQDIKSYKVFDDGVEINQNVKFKGVVKNFPFKIRAFNGDLDISHNPITSFKNFPDMINGNLKAIGLNIQNINGLPVVKGNMVFDSCKYLMDISGLQEEITGDISFYGCSIKNVNLPNTKHISGDINLSNNGTSSISKETDLIVDGYVSLSDNLINNQDMFLQRIKAININFSGNPCTSKDEFETECNW